MSTPTGHTFKVYMQSLKWAQSGILSGWPQYHVTVAVSLGKFLGDGDANGRQIPRPWKGGEPPSAQGPARGPTRGQVRRMTSQIDCHPHRLLINLLPLVSGEAWRGPILPTSFSSNKGPLLLLTGVVSGRQVETGLWTLCSDKVPTKPRGQPGSPPTPGGDEVIPYHRPLESAKP